MFDCSAKKLTYITASSVLCVGNNHLALHWYGHFKLHWYSCRSFPDPLTGPGFWFGATLTAHPLIAATSENPLVL